MLTITYITLEDGADYTCLVSNEAGSTNVTASLFITPEIIQQPQSINTTVGSAVAFTCLATGYPTPQYRWNKVDSLGGVIVTTVGNGSVLTFDPVSLGGEGYYHCIASVAAQIPLVYETQSDVALLTSKQLESSQD